MKSNPEVLHQTRLQVTIVGAGLARPALGVLFSASSAHSALSPLFSFAPTPAGSKTHPPTPSSHSPPAEPTHAPAPQSISYSPPDSPPKSESPPAIPST